MPPTSVTVVIPVYNRESYVSIAIESVLNQTYHAWKLIIVDDASTDNTKKAIAKYTKNKKITYLCLPENKGVGHALNLALGHIKTPYFVILDSDDWLEKDALEILIHEMEKQPASTSLIYGNAVEWEEIDNELHKTNEMKYRSFTDKYEFLLYSLMPCPRFFRTSAVLEVNGFETNIPYEGRYGEDRYLLLKLIGKGHFFWIDKNLYNTRKHNTNLTTRENKKKFAKVRKCIVERVLKQWGNEFEPVFGNSDGWVNVKELVSRDGKKERWVLNKNKSKMMKLPFISVIIVTYNRDYLIKRAVDSVLSQTFQNFEIIIVDDGSVDGTEQIIKNYKDHRIISRKHVQNQGNRAAIKTGLKEAKGTYIAFLDSDDEWLPAKLEQQIKFIESIPEKENTVTYTQVIRIYENRQEVRPSKGKQKEEQLGDYFFLKYGLMQNSTLLIPRSILLKMNDLPDIQRHNDWDLCLRLEKLGCEFHFFERPLTIWYCDKRADRNSRNPMPDHSLNWIISHKDHISEKAMMSFVRDFVVPYLKSD